jgi:uncharacterized damage-inducible protein DinB
MVLHERFVAFARRKLGDHHGQIRRCVALCTPQQVWQRVNAHSNSIGNLVLHLRGNVMQWIVAGLGGRPFERDRPAEFAPRAQEPVEPAMERLAETLAAADAVLAGLSAEALERTYEIQGYTVTGLEAVFQTAEHFALHTGQIVVMTKALLDCDLNVYDVHGRRLDGRASGAP